ncbi:MAG: 30S ribosomal protein S8 [Candidatus Berkelbacteria bacterium]|nr:30S ribosomal protein S8 [Candidatus Berkelbacteria bacterium]
MDPIADMLTTIRNNMAAGNEQALVPHSKLKLAVLELLKLKQIIDGFEVEEIEFKKMIKVSVKRSNILPHLKRISKPGRRVFVKAKDIKAPLSGLGFVIVSTPKGILTGAQAKKIGVGGELICEVW